MPRRRMRRLERVTAGIFAASLFWLAASLARAQCTGCPKPSFGPAARAFRVGTGSFSGATTADLAGGGEIEIILTTDDQFGSSASVTILRQLQPGEFLAPVFYPLPVRSLAVAAGDFTGDGVPDIVASGNGFSNGLYLLRGLPLGGFDTFQDVSPQSQTSFLASGDFNGDGWLDVASNTSNRVRFFLGNGTGGFSTPIDVPAGPGIGSLTAADFNGDGRVDVVTTNQGSNTISVILGVPAPPFAPATNFVVSNTPFSAAASDFNSDNKIDLAVSTFGNGLNVLLGSGTGSFSAPIHVAAVSGLVVVGDFQGDGKPDIAAIPQNASQPELWELTNSGTGSFLVRRHAGWRGTPLAADFTRDGATDLAIVATGAGFPSLTETNVFLIAGSSDGLKTSPITVANPFGLIGPLASGNLNGDPFKDVVYGIQGGMQVGLGTGLGTFTSGQVFSNLFSIVAIEAGDVSGDGNTDILALQYNELSVFLGDGVGQFAPGGTYPVGSNASDLALGDLNTDGRTDVVVTNALSGSISVLLGMAGGVLQSQGKYAVGQEPRGVVVARLDADSHPDLAVTTTGWIVILLSNGAGGFRSIELFGTTTNAGSPYSPVAADFSGDGNIDIAVLLPGFSGTSFIAVFPGTGAGQLQAPEDWGVFGTPSHLETADFNQDSRPDLFVAGPTRGSVLVNSGTGFEEPVSVWVGDPGHSGVIGDFVGSALPDIAVASGGSRTIVVLPNTNCQVARLQATGPTGCFAAGQPFPGQPVVEVRDDGGNRITCDTGVIAASIAPGTGAAGAILLGNASVPAVAGTATFTNLAVDRAGSEYRLQFNHPVAGATRSRAFSTTDTTMTAPGSVCPYATGQIASVADAGLGATYTWTIFNGQITGGEGTRSVTFRAGPFGQTRLEVLIHREDCDYTVVRSVPISSAGCPAPAGFFTVPPCRLFDTRDIPGPFGAPSLTAGAGRSVSVVSRCGIPSTAKALSLNVTATQPSAPGYVTIYPGGTPFPPTSTVNYSTGQTRANNAIIPVGAAGDLTAFCGQITGTVDVILDVNGYFE